MRGVSRRRLGVADRTIWVGHSELAAVASTIRHGGRRRWSLEQRSRRADLDLTDRTAAVVRDPDVGAIRRHSHGALPTGIVLTTVPVDASISLTVPSSLFATQTWVPSDDTPWGLLPTGIVLTTVPVDASISLTVSPS